MTSDGTCERGGGGSNEHPRELLRREERSAGRMGINWQDPSSRPRRAATAGSASASRKGKGKFDKAPRSPRGRRAVKPKNTHGHGAGTQYKTNETRPSSGIAAASPHLV
jgi:hypothetical protein